MDDRDRVIALLVERLGGDVVISERDLLNAHEVELLQLKSERSFNYIFRTRRTIEGELAEEAHPTQAQLDGIVRNHRDALAAGYAAVLEAVTPRPVVPRDRVISRDENDA